MEIQRWEGAARKCAEHSEQLAEKAVKAGLPRIEEHIAAELEIPADVGVESVNGVKVASIEKVQTPDPEWFAEGDRVTITARLLLAVMAEVRRYPSVFAPQEVLKVGQKRKLLTYRDIPTGVLAQEELPKTATVEFEATYRDENFVDLEPTSVSLTSGALWGDLIEKAARSESE